MMNIYLMIAILLANIISIAIVYQFIKKLDKKQKVIFVAISVAIMYILISFVYWISGIGIDEKIHEASKSFILYLFVPVNVILFIPYFAYQYMKLKAKQIKPEKFFNKICVIIALIIIVLVIEYFYFRDIQTNIKNIDTNNKVEIQNIIESETQNELLSNEVIINGNVIDEIISSEVTNVINNEIELNEVN